MPRFTDEQVDAARMALPAFSFPTPSQMRAALNAAADAAPEPDALHERLCQSCGGSGMSMPGGGSCGICGGMGVGPSEFDEALDEFWEAMRATMFTDGTKKGDFKRETNAQAARQRLIDMFREAAR